MTAFRILYNHGVGCYKRYNYGYFRPEGEYSPVPFKNWKDILDIDYHPINNWVDLGAGKNGYTITYAPINSKGIPAYLGTDLSELTFPYPSGRVNMAFLTMNKSNKIETMVVSNSRIIQAPLSPIQPSRTVPFKIEIHGVLTFTTGV